MKKKLMMLVAMAVAMNANAAMQTVDGITWTYTVNNGMASIGSGSPSSTAVPQSTKGSITIPSSLGGYSVTSIGSWAFHLCSSITSVEIPDSVTSIGSSAFNQCDGLVAVAIPSTVTSIGDNAFNLCRCLQSMTIPNGVVSIGSSAFDDCSRLTTIMIPASLTSIGSYVFSGCSGLESITVDAINPVYDSRDNCNAIIRTADNTLIQGCKNTTIPHSVTSIGACAFYQCDGLTTLTIPSCVTSIGARAFTGCDNLTSIVVPDSVTGIGGAAFQFCHDLKRVTIGNGVTNIGTDMFSGCDSAMSVTLGNCVTNIGKRAFNNCTCAVSFTGMPPSGIGNVAENCVVVYPPEYAEQWKQALSQLPLKQKFIAKVYQSAIRENDPTIMDVCYCVWKIGCDGQQFVSVRALAFENGTRSFTTVVRPETFVDGTATNIGDNVAANVEHTLSWKVSSDWATRLAKVKFEVLASDGELLPLELRTIPASDQYGKLEFSRNEITTSQVFDALLWLYADKDTGLTLYNGILRNGSTQLASGNGTTNPSAISYIYSKMGYNLLSGSVLNYVNSETRLGLSPSGARQYAYKIVEDGE